MQVVITAVGPDNRGLADPIVHHVTGMGANIAEIQMYDHDEESVFSMLTRIELAADRQAPLVDGERLGLAIDSDGNAGHGQLQSSVINPRARGEMRAGAH